MSEIKFSQFTNGGDLLNSDTIVGLRSGINTKFDTNFLNNKGGFLWNSITAGGSHTVTNGNAYLSNTSGVTSYVLPTTADVGDTFRISRGSAPDWILTVNTGQNILVGSSDSGNIAGSFVASNNAFTTMDFTCTVANTTWEGYNITGNLSVSPILPTDLAGLMFWGAADDLNNGAPLPSDGTSINTWFDKSGLGNNLTSTGSARPLFHINIQNSLPGVLYDGISQFMQNLTVSNTNDTFYMYLVGKVVSVPGANYGLVSIYDSALPNDIDNLHGIGNSFYPNPGYDPMRESLTISTITTAPVVGTPFVLSIVLNGTNAVSTVSPGNTSTVTNAGTTGNFGQNAIITGSRWYGGVPSYFLNQYQFEIIIGGGSISMADDIGIRNYLSNKWAITL